VADDEDILKQIIRTAKTVPGATARAKGFAPTAKDAVLEQATPVTRVPNTTPLNYQQYSQRAAVYTDNPLTEQEFNQLARSDEPARFYAAAQEKQVQRTAEEQAYQRLVQKYEPMRLQQESMAVVERAQEALRKSGQGEQLTAENFQDIAYTAAALLMIEGDSEDEQAARAQGAQILSEHSARLAPHLEARLGPDWLSSQQEHIQQVLEEGPPQGEGKMASFLNFPLVKIPLQFLETLNDVEQGYLHTIAGIAGAVGQGFDAFVGGSEENQIAGDYLKHAGSSALRTIGSVGNFPARLAGKENPYGISPSRGITTADGVWVPDADLSGDANLREFAGIDPEAGGFLGDVADLVGMILIDPLTWTTLGTNTSSKVAISALRQSPERLAQVAGQRMRNGARFADLEDVYQLSARQAFTQYQKRAVANPSNWQLVKKNFRRHPSEVLQHLTKEIDNTEKLTEALIKSRVDRMMKATERGLFPAIRIGNRPIVPLTRFYDTLGFIDTRLARGDAWVDEVRHIADVKSPDELLHFIRTYEGSALPEELHDQIRKWSVFTERLDEDPYGFLDEVLQRTPGPSRQVGDDAIDAAAREVSQRPDDVFDSLEQFGRLLLGDDAVADWRRWYDEEWAYDARYIFDDAAPPTGRLSDPVDAIRQQAVDAPLLRVVEALNPFDLSDLARARVLRNIDVFQKPTILMPKETFGVKGLRSLTLREDTIGHWLRRISDTFSPRAPLRRAQALGDDIALDIENLTAIERAKREAVTDHVNRLGIHNGRSKLYDDAAEEMAARTPGSEDLDRWLNDALSRSPDQIDDLIESTARDGLENSATLLQVLRDVRQDIFDLSIAAGFDEQVMLELKGYLPRAHTEEAIKWARRQASRGVNREQAKVMRKLGLLGDTEDVGMFRANPLEQAGHARGRSFMRDTQNIFEVNEAAEKMLRESGLSGTDGFKLYEDNPVRAMLFRSREAHEARAWMDMIRGMTDLTDIDGRPLAYIARNSDDNTSTLLRKSMDDKDFARTGADYRMRELPDGTQYWMRTEIDDEISRVIRIVRDPNALNWLQRGLTGWNNVWGAWATVPLVGGFGFHARNAVGNIFNMMLAGFRSPGAFKEAFDLQRLYANARKAIDSEHITLPDALRKLGATPAEVDMLTEARKFGILGGQVADIFTASDTLKGAGKGLANKANLNPFDQEHILLRSGRTIGSAIENNARLALFIDGRINKGMNGVDAAKRVRTFLFDYGDLTGAETAYLRMFNRFYTFARKNTALQARIIMTQPGKVMNAQRVVEEFERQVLGFGGYDEDGRVDPGAILPGGERIPSWVPSTMGLYTNEQGHKLVAGVDSPFVASAEVIDSLASALKSPFAFAYQQGGDRDSLEFAQRSEIYREQLSNALALLSGGPVESVKTFAEQATQEDLFIGGSLADIDKDWLDGYLRLVDMFIPAATKVKREVEYSDDYYNALLNKYGGRTPPDDEVLESARLLNTLLGFTAVTGMSDPDQITRNMNSLTYELSESLGETQRRLGSDVVPSIDDLMKAGEAYTENRAVEYLIYNTLDGEPLSAEERQDLMGMVPNTVLEAYGINVPGGERAEFDEKEKARRIQEIMSALQALGKPVTKEMEYELLLRESGAFVRHVRELGIEPSFQRNRYLSGGPEQTEEELYQQSVYRLTTLADFMGTSILDIQQTFPMLEEYERMVRDMREAGYADGLIYQELLSKMNRQEQAMIAGEDSLTKTRSYELMTPDELIKFQQKWSAKKAELLVTMIVGFGYPPTQEQLDEWMSEVMFTAPEQRALGFDNYTAPSAENITPDEIYDARLQQKLNAIGETESGIPFLAGLGQ